MSTYAERCRDNAAEMEQAAAEHRAEGRMDAAEKCERVACRCRAKAEAAEAQARAIAHRNVGHFDAADAEERLAREAERRAAEVHP